MLSLHCAFSTEVLSLAGAVATQLWRQLMHLAQHDQELSSPKYRLGSAAHRRKVSTSFCIAMQQMKQGVFAGFGCPASTTQPAQPCKVLPVK